ncbi:DUF2971 domain-containing protein [Vibrio sp. RC27]
MSDVDEIDNTRIIKWIRECEYSSLVFLDEIWNTSKNPDHLGLYYFIQYQKGLNTDEVFSEIVSRCKGEYSACTFLGAIAKRIYGHLDGNRIAASFFRRARDIDTTNFIAHYMLFKETKDVDAYIRVLEFLYEQGHSAPLVDAVNSIIETLVQPSPPIFKKEHWESIKQFIFDGKLTCSPNLLMHMHFYLNEDDDCLAIIENSAEVSATILKHYYEEKQITKEDAISKVKFSEVEALFGDDHKVIYEVYRQEFYKDKKIPIDKRKPNNLQLIEKAFRAEIYQDVIFIYDKNARSVMFTQHRSPNLYYLLACNYLNKKPKKPVIPQVYLSIATAEEDALHLAFLCRQNINKLENTLSTGKLSSEIELVPAYDVARRYLDHPSLSKHYLYDKLKLELSSMAERWHEQHHHQRFKYLNKIFKQGKISNIQFRMLISSGFVCEEYDYLIQIIFKYNLSHIPSMSSYTHIAACYEHKTDIDAQTNALKYYKLAVDLMKTSGEYNHRVIHNYINFAKRSKTNEVPESEIKELREKYNESWTNQFRWDNSIAKGNRLYKYTSFNENTKDGLKNQYFYFASRDELNDPIELPTRKHINPDSLIDPDYRICSITRNPNSILMWSHYANQHKGVMIEYCFGTEIPRGVGVREVSYIYEHNRNKEKDMYSFPQYILTKNYEWSYEEEVRLFSNTKTKVYFESYNYKDDNKDKINARIVSITLGCEFPKSEMKNVHEIVDLINSKLPCHEAPVIIKQADIPDYNLYTLEYKEATT